MSGSELRRKNQKGRRDEIPTAFSTFPTWSCFYVGGLRSRRAVVLAIGMACTWDLNRHTYPPPRAHGRATATGAVVVGARRVRVIGLR
jgi:hypothetical protein